ncbi:MAG: hypothetical protein WAO98_00965 [Alphaproteobacteria bacterium]
MPSIGMTRGSRRWVGNSNLGRTGAASKAHEVPDDVAAQIRARYETTGPIEPSAPKERIPRPAFKRYW